MHSALICRTTHQAAFHNALSDEFWVSIAHDPAGTGVAPCPASLAQHDTLAAR
jgi:hypothetical protein